MKRTERHIITKFNDNYKTIDYLCFLSKNLYNYVNFLIREDYFKNKNLEIKDRKYIDQFKVINLLTKENQSDYRALPSQCSQQIIINLFQNWKSFWKLLKTKNLKGKPKMPKFKHKTEGRNLLIFTNQNARLQKDGFIKFHNLTNLNPVKTKVNKDSLKQARIIPRSSCYVIEVVYEKEKEERDLDSSQYLSIDLGINNFATLVTNQDEKPLLVNGKTLKSINQYYNKKKAKLMSFVGGEGISNRIKSLNLKRNNKVHDYMHKTSRFIINYCLIHKIKTIIIGYNEGWKDNINIGKSNNQKFTNIPYLKFLNQLKYKAEEVGILVIDIEESYTSKCDSLALEKIQKKNLYLGKRIHRGLFKSSVGKLINADVNGSINIMRKVIDDEIVKSLVNRGYVLQPVRINPN
jgi:putative transposase